MSAASGALAALPASLPAATVRAVTAGQRGASAARPAAVVPAAYRKRNAVGDPTPLVCTVAKTALEVVLGSQGIDQLARWVTPELRSHLLAQHSLARRASYEPRGTVGIARVRLCRVSARAVEAAVVATEGDRARAIAMRLEVVAGRWSVTHMDIG